MEAIIHRFILVGTVIAIALNFPKMIAWQRLGEVSANPSNLHPSTHPLLRQILRIEFFFYILLLAFALSHPTPSRFLVYPLTLLHLPCLIIGDRKLTVEIPRSAHLRRVVRLIPFYNILENVNLTIIALELHGAVTF